ncbi:hypothetical protein ACT7LO_003018 [Providencia rettgeri]
MTDKTMEFKHTPAPWHVGSPSFKYKDTQIVRSANESAIAHISHLRETGVAVANANLIAAAPELLKSLGELISVMERYEIDVGESAPVKHKKMMKKAKAAISKALGQQ